MVMSEESEGRQGRGRNLVRCHDSDLRAAIVDQDLGRIQDLTRKYGSNCCIKIADVAAPAEDFWKGLAILPLHLAASHRRAESMQSLLSAGADPEIRDWLGQTTLHVVIASWPRVFTTRPGPTIKTAVRTRAEACLRLLCERGVDVNAEVEGGSHQTALHLSVRYMAPSAIHILAGYGADVNAVDGSGMTPLHMAAGILRRDIIASLIEEGADVNMGVRHSGNSPLHLAVVALATKNTKKSPADGGGGCIRELLERGAEVDAANKDGVTPLHEACVAGNEELVDLLLRHGAGVKKRSEAGESCLFLFLNRGANARNGSLLAKLFSLTHPISVRDDDGRLPSTLTLPRFFKQRDRLLRLIRRPKRLQEICKIAIYLKHVQDERDELREVLPEKVYDFVFHSWEDLRISFATDGEQDSLDDSSETAPV